MKELLTPDEIPFNLAGEPLDNRPSAEGEARARAEAEAEQRKAQRTFDDEAEHQVDLETESRRAYWECTGTWDGISVGSDADSGL